MLKKAQKVPNFREKTYFQMYSSCSNQFKNANEKCQYFLFFSSGTPYIWRFSWWLVSRQPILFQNFMTFGWHYDMSKTCLWLSQLRWKVKYIKSLEDHQAPLRTNLKLFLGYWLDFNWHFSWVFWLDFLRLNLVEKENIAKWYTLWGQQCRAIDGLCHKVRCWAIKQ